MSEKKKKLIKSIIPKRVVKELRKRSILKQHKKVAAYWNPVIDDYFTGSIDKFNLKAKKKINHSKIIWQYWGQGIEAKDLPEIVQICFASVDKYKEDYEVIRLTDNTIAGYIDFPDFVYEKLKNKNFTRTFFSDLLRLALLNVYGGVWLDATILLTGNVPQEYENMDYFAFQRSATEENKHYWENVYAYYFGWHKDFKVSFLSSIMFAKPLNKVISTLLDLMLFYWKTEKELSDYFCFQILYHELIHGRLAVLKCPVANDCNPHIIQTKINGNYNLKSFDEAFQLSTMHKMAYFDKEGLGRLKKLLDTKSIQKISDKI